MSVLERLASRDAKIAIVGQGYVGLVIAMRASEAGLDVVGMEADPDRVAQLQAGESYIEDISDEVLRAALDRGYLPASDPAAMAGFDVAVITVPTPLRDHVPDLSHVEAAAAAVGAHLQRGACVVLESTTYPGTTEELVAPILEGASGLVAGRDFLLGYSPERIDPGNPTYGLANTPKVVSGIDEASLAAVDAFYSTFVAQTVPVSGCGEAELSKIIENTFRHVNIALVNELAMFATELGVDVMESLRASATKPFGFMRFQPGPGVGGHCLPIDPTYLSWRVKQSLGESFRFIELANDVNSHMPHFIARRATAVLNDVRKPVKGSRIVVFGVSYKPNVGDAREAPSLPLIQALVGLGAEVTAVDPLVRPPVALLHANARLVTAVDLASEPCDLAIVVTDHDAFDYDAIAALPLVLDTRNRLDTSRPNVHGI